MNKQTSVKELLRQIEHLTSIYHFALGSNGNLGIMISYLNRKGFSYAFPPEDKSLDPLVCPLFKETLANELDYLCTQVKIAARHEIASLECMPTS